MKTYKICDRCKGTKQARRPYFLKSEYGSINFTKKVEFYPCPGCEGQGLIEVNSELVYAIMNKELSDVLADNYGILTFLDFKEAFSVAKNFKGVVVPSHIAQWFMEENEKK